MKWEIRVKTTLFIIFLINLFVAFSLAKPLYVLDHRSNLMAFNIVDNTF